MGGKSKPTAPPVPEKSSDEVQRELAEERKRQRTRQGRGSTVNVTGSTFNPPTQRTALLGGGFPAS